MERKWDDRLSSLRVYIDTSKVNYGERYWRITHAWLTVNGNWETVPEWAREWQRDTLGGDHHAFGRALFADGTLAAQAGFQLRWPDGQDFRLPEPDGWANIPLYAGYDPVKGPGPYTWAKVGNAEVLAGLGLPITLGAMGGHHVSFFAVWQETVPEENPPTPTPEWETVDIRWGGLTLEGVQIRRR